MLNKIYASHILGLSENLILNWCNLNTKVSILSSGEANDLKNYLKTTYPFLIKWVKTLLTFSEKSLFPSINVLFPQKWRCCCCIQSCASAAAPSSCLPLAPSCGPKVTQPWPPCDPRGLNWGQVWPRLGLGQGAPWGCSQEACSPRHSSPEMVGV